MRAFGLSVSGEGGEGTSMAYLPLSGSRYDDAMGGAGLWLIS